MKTFLSNEGIYRAINYKQLFPAGFSGSPILALSWYSTSDSQLIWHNWLSPDIPQLLSPDIWQLTLAWYITIESHLIYHNWLSADMSKLTLTWYATTDSHLIYHNFLSPDISQLTVAWYITIESHLMYHNWISADMSKLTLTWYATTDSNRMCHNVYPNRVFEYRRAKMAMTSIHYALKSHNSHTNHCSKFTAITVQFPWITNKLINLMHFAMSVSGLMRFKQRFLEMY
jgi:hypothetical protein